MPYLSPVADSPASHLIAEIQSLKLGKLGERYRPHKLLLLLAVTELFEAGVIGENRIYYDENLKAAFSSLFDRHKKRGDRERPARPFFHLRSASFWRHRVKEGRARLYKTMTSDECYVRDNIDYAYLSDDAFRAFSEARPRNEVADVLHLLVIQKC